MAQAEDELWQYLQCAGVATAGAGYELALLVGQCCVEHPDWDVHRALSHVVKTPLGAELWERKRFEDLAETGKYHHIHLVQ